MYVSLSTYTPERPCEGMTACSYTTHTFPPSKECCLGVEGENRSNPNNLHRNKQRRHNPATLQDIIVSITANICPSLSYLQDLHFRGDYFHARWDHRCINKKREVLGKTESICNTQQFLLQFYLNRYMWEKSGDKQRRCRAREHHSGRAGHYSPWKGC